MSIYQHIEDLDKFMEEYWKSAGLKPFGSGDNHGSYQWVGYKEEDGLVQRHIIFSLTEIKEGIHVEFDIAILATDSDYFMRPRIISFFLVSGEDELEKESFRERLRNELNTALRMAEQLTRNDLNERVPRMLKPERRLPFI